MILRRMVNRRWILFAEEGERVSTDELTLCVLLWARDGQAAALIEYEDQVLQLVSEHGGSVLQRARSDATDGDPLEIQLFRFPSQRALDAYLNDGRRAALAGIRDRVVSRTQIMRVDLI